MAKLLNDRRKIRETGDGNSLVVRGIHLVLARSARISLRAIEICFYGFSKYNRCWLGFQCDGIAETQEALDATTLRLEK